MALVLALALLWYSINPAPTAVIRRSKRSEDEDRDAERRDAEREINISPLSAGAHRPQLFEAAHHPPSSSGVDDEDDFEWPEFIDG